MAIGWVVAFVLVTGVRVLAGWQTISWESITSVSLITVPVFFLYGIGCFETWLYWISGKPTKPDDHSDHGAFSWKRTCIPSGVSTVATRSFIS